MPAIGSHRPSRLSCIFGLGAALMLSAATLTVPTPAGAFNDTTHLAVYFWSGQVATAGVPFGITVEAQNAGNQTDYCFNDEVHFAFTDPAAVKPANYGFLSGICGLSGHLWGDGGTHWFYVTPAAAGPQTLTVTDVAHPSVTAGTVTINVAPGPATSLTVAGLAASVVQGARTPFRVTAKDAWNNVATNYAGTVHFVLSDGSPTLPANYTFNAGDAGTAAFTVSFASIGSQSVTVTDTLAPSTLHATASTTVGTAPHFDVQCYDQIAGEATSCSVTARTAVGAIDTGYVGTVQFTSSDLSADLPIDYVFQIGQHGEAYGFDPTFYRAGVQTLIVTDKNNSAIFGTGSLNVLGGDTVGVSIVGLPSSMVAGSVPITVKTRDAYGNWGSSGTIHFTSSDPRAVLPGDFTFHGVTYGSQQFTITLKTPGVVSLSVSGSNWLGSFSTSANTTVSHGEATNLLVTSTTSWVAGVSHSVNVTAKDAYDNIDPTYYGAVHFTSSDPQAVLPADYQFIGADVGTHTVNVTLKTMGTHSVTATDTVTASISGSQSGIVVQGNPAAGATYHPITPVRLLDTRSGNGLSGKLLANTPATFQVAGRGGVSAYATAVTGNVTVVNPTNSWAVYLGPSPIAYPSTSTINFAGGEVAGNGLTVALSGTGALSATYMSTAGNTTDLVFDVTGYFTPDMSGATYHAMSPARLLDTRVGNGLAGKLLANTPATFNVANRSDIPGDAIAVTGNVTVVNPTNSWAIYLGPDPIANPTTSTINFNTGEVKGNNLTVSLGAGGTLSATYMSTAGNTTDLVFDVTGYYTADLTGAVYVPLTPVRMLDTRSGNGLSGKLSANTPATFNVAGRATIPSPATAVTGNVTVVNETFGWAVFLGPDPTPSPTTSTVNFNAGDVKGNGLTVALGSGGTLSATYISTSGNTTDLVFDVTGYFVQ